MAPDAPAPDLEEPFSAEELREGWSLFDAEERSEAFHLLPRPVAEDFFLELVAADQAQLVLALPLAERRSWLRLLAPDDAADLMQAVPVDERPGLIALLDEVTQKDVAGLLAFAEDHAGGLMNPRYARVRPDMSADEAVVYLRKMAREHLGTFYYAYVLDPESRLLGVVSLRELFVAASDKKVRDVMQSDVVKADETMDQEALGKLFAQHNLVAIPIVDAEGRMKGVVTVDDIVDVVQEEATEDIQKMGGLEALDAPYLQTGFWKMVRKRAGWLAVLFVGETLTASALGHYQGEIDRAGEKAAFLMMLFLPLIISSGGNSGSQATTLVIRALALGEVKLRDWWHVVRREVLSGLMLGLVLATIGFLRIVIWAALGWSTFAYPPVLVGLTVAVSLVGVVTLGTITGSMLPFILKRLGFDPASASAPFVATLVDVTGLVIFFSVATWMLFSGIP
jgi:magnesium transporter